MMGTALFILGSVFVLFFADVPGMKFVGWVLITGAYIMARRYGNGG